jgi:heme-degrading monooxygenase HmoA
MLANWILAEASNRAAFNEAQKRWSDLVQFDGFIAQVGGWVESFPATAGILAVWRDFSAYRQSLETDHDELANQPRKTDMRIETSIANVIMQISQLDPRRLAESAQCLRISDATLQPNSSPIFVARQMETWNPALRSADGMLGALICRVDRNRDRFLGATFWRDRAALENFQQAIFPEISKQASTETYMKSLVSYHFTLEPSWSVVKPA